MGGAVAAITGVGIDEAGGGVTDVTGGTVKVGARPVGVGGDVADGTTVAPGVGINVGVELGTGGVGITATTAKLLK